MQLIMVQWTIKNHENKEEFNEKINTFYWWFNDVINFKITIFYNFMVGKQFSHGL